MTDALNDIQDLILESVKGVIKTDSFNDWFSKIKPKPSDGDIVVFNNCFIHRKDLVTTTKNKKYLAIKIKNVEPDLSEVFVVYPKENVMDKSEFRIFSRSSELSTEPLNIALKEELESLGQLVFVLIGKLQELPVEVEIDNIMKLKFDPSATSTDLIEDRMNTNKVIVLNQLNDPEEAWDIIKTKLGSAISDPLEFEKIFKKQFSSLRELARIKLDISKISNTVQGNSFIGRIISSVYQQRISYEKALSMLSPSTDPTKVNMREILRIAYNFADDAIKILKLLVSVADLKAVILWCTLNEHFEIARSFKELEKLTKASGGKPSVKSYKENISNARNRAFHDLLDFDRTIDVELHNVNFKARRLTLLPPYKQRKTFIAFDYEDREIVEVLSELARAPEVALPYEFWKRNLLVMKAFEDLLKATEKTLLMLHRAKMDGRDAT